MIKSVWTSVLLFIAVAATGAAPNILWIYVDDMSDWMGCYGYTSVPTPHIDSLAEGGVRFENAYMPAPVCSATRSAIITGTMQTTHGLHQHRTMIKNPLPETILTVPELFRQAGYTTFNEAKEDYNFTRDRDLMYSPDFKRPTFKSHMAGRNVSWLEQLKDHKFFGQIQLKGGKFEGETGSKYPMPSRVKQADIEVPPYYPDTPVMRNAIARHYEQIAETDEQVGAIIDGLKQYDLWENTAVFFFTDHGCPLPRSKQFLYEDGTKVPLIVHWPAGKAQLAKRGTVRADLVSGIDITTSSLGLADIAIPDFMEGQDVFSPDFIARDYVISARDRCGIAVDRIRAVRTEKFRYIRNYQTDRPFYQAQYRDGFASIKNLRELHAANQLSPLQASYHEAAKRSAEELYDLEKDPHQTVNLAGNPEYAKILKQHQRSLATWQEETGDQGDQPESRESLEKVYKVAKGKAPAPEFDFLRK